MYWYPFSDDEEERAWAQADAHADINDADGTKKFIGNLGELAVEQYLSEYSTSDRWNYRNKAAMERHTEEYEPIDFEIGRDNLALDVKTTTDIRKFDPVSMYRNEDERGAGFDREGYPNVNPDTADVFIFVLVSHARETAPNSQIYGVEDVEDEWDELPAASQRMITERSGNRVAGLLGWLSADEFDAEMAANMNDGAKGKFTRLGIRDMHELLQRADALDD